MRTALDLERWKVLSAGTSSVQVTIQFLFKYLTFTYLFNYHLSLESYRCKRRLQLCCSGIELKFSLKYLRTD